MERFERKHHRMGSSTYVNTVQCKPNKNKDYLCKFQIKFFINF